MEAKCDAAKFRPSAEINSTVPCGTFSVFTLEMRHDSYGLVQHCNDVTKFKQAKNKASNRVFWETHFP